MGGFFSYPTTVLDHVTNTGSAIFISEAMYAGNFPMTWGVDNDGNPETGICDESGFGQGGWRVCLGDSAGATNT